jgi:transcriptional regulator with XRE-family HTH domain
VAKPNERDLIKAEFAKRLQRHLDDRGWNQSDLARAASAYLPKGQEFRRDNISVYLKKLALPRPKQLQAIAKALRVEAEDLIPGIEHDGGLPYSMRNSDTPGKAWLHVDMKVPMRVALQVLSLLDGLEGQ